MKRDMDLVRKLLLYVEDKGTYNGIDSTDVGVEGYTPGEIGYNLSVMADGGLLDAVCVTAMDDEFPSYLIDGITWQGHEFLDSVRDDGIWTGVKKAMKPVGTASLGVMMTLATSLVKQKLGLP